MSGCWGERLLPDAGRIISGSDSDSEFDGITMQSWPRFKLFDGSVETVEPSERAETAAVVAHSIRSNMAAVSFFAACKYCKFEAEHQGNPNWRCRRHGGPVRCRCDYFDDCHCWHRTPSTEAICTGHDIPCPRPADMLHLLPKSESKSRPPVPLFCESPRLAISSVSQIAESSSTATLPDIESQTDETQPEAETETHTLLEKSPSSC